MIRFKRVILPNGTLNEREIIKKEVISQSTNGKVERFFLTPSESYIFKTLNTPIQIATEIWVNKHVLNNLPPIYPKLVAFSSHLEDEQPWLIFEDLGPLNHTYDLNTVIGVTKQMAAWHSLPLESINNVTLQGLKPPIDQMQEQIKAQKKEVAYLCKQRTIPSDIIHHVYDYLDYEFHSFASVFSHGDLHLGNYAKTNGKVFVLDWEHGHVNSPFWDLYHLIDLSHPLYPKNITPLLRNHVLECYINEKAKMIQINHELFKWEYYLFSSIFSLWMLLLINRDLITVGSIWPKSKLKTQLSETIKSMLQCGYKLNKKSIVKSANISSRV